MRTALTASSHEVRRAGQSPRNHQRFEPTRRSIPRSSDACYQHDMLRGERIGLRARQEADVAILHTELYDDVATANRAFPVPWRPLLPGVEPPFAIEAPSDAFARFSVVELATDELIGHAALWGIDLHHRLAHIGLGLRPAVRGRGFAVDVVRTLCHYGFTVHGLHRIQVDTLADNHPMIRAAARCGFVHEGTTRCSGWVDGRFVDEVILGMLDHEWYAKQLPVPDGPAIHSS
jgi:RimJ/RimL family protein N-acetyltransferase